MLGIHFRPSVAIFHCLVTFVEQTNFHNVFWLYLKPKSEYQIV